MDQPPRMNEPGWFRTRGPAPEPKEGLLAKPSINVHPVAARYAAPNERIVEFSAPSGAGGLISLELRTDGTIGLNVYRHEQTEVTVGKADDE